jgi:tetratricopeptide (TPR) repeat protein
VIGRAHGERMTSDGSGAKWDAAEEGAELLREGEADRAVDELERVIASDPNNEYAHYFLGAAHFEKGRFEKAMKAYLRALEIAPNYLGALVHLGHALRMLGKHGEALRVGNAALERSNEDGDALHLMALVHYARGEKAAAIKFLERFLATRPELEAANEAEGMLRMLRGQIDETKPDRELN